MIQWFVIDKGMIYDGRVWLVLCVSDIQIPPETEERLRGVGATKEWLRGSVTYLPLRNDLCGEVNSIH